MSEIPASLTELPLGEFVRLCGIEPYGSLLARRARRGDVLFYWRHGTRRQRLAVHLPAAQADLPTHVRTRFATARRLAQSLALDHARQNGKLRGETLQLPLEDPTVVSSPHTPMVRPGSVLATLLAYSDNLAAASRPGARDVRSVALRHVAAGHPEIAALAARRFRPSHRQTLVRSVLDAGKPRTAAKLHTYLRCAWRLATLPAVPEEARPARTRGKRPGAADAGSARTPAPSTSPQALPRPGVPLPVLRLYWQAIRDAEGLRGAVLRLHLLCGAPRLAPFLQLMTGNVDGATLTLMDATGRPGAPPRPLTLPLTRPAAQAMALCVGGGVYALSGNGGRTPLAASTVANWIAQATERLGALTPGGLRAGFSDWLAQQNTDPLLAARLLSRGVPRAQTRRLDGHGFLPEKRRVLEHWARWLDGASTARHAQADPR